MMTQEPKRRQAAPKQPSEKKPSRRKPAGIKSAPAKRGTKKSSAGSQSAKTSTKTSAKQSGKKKASGRRWSRFGRWMFFSALKLGLAILAVVFVMGIYLDTLVRDKFDGQLWDLPAVVYGRVLDLQPGQAITLSEVRRELDALQYHKVRTPQRAGEYSASSTRIELIRRPFEFEDGYESQRHVMLTFDDSGLSKVFDLGREKSLGYLRIEPKMLGMLGTKEGEQRIFTPRKEFPEVLIDALLATEDRDFYHHSGVSPLAILRAAVVNLKAGRTVQGGSTLTQQLAKNIFLTRERSLWRKIQEAYIAVIIDYRYSKDRILEAYLNEVYLGQSSGREIHGFGLGARLYFGRPLQELRIDQLAMLVGMVKGPSYYNPWRHTERARERRDLVLRLMLDQGILTGPEYEQAATRKLDVQKQAVIASRQPAYFQLLQRELTEKVGNRFTPGVGLRIFSTLDPVSQQEAERAVAQWIPALEKKVGGEIETAMVAVDRHTGEIRAMIGGSRPGYAGFNRALEGRRQIGSLVKPAVYLSALRQPEKYTLASTLDDKPILLKGNQGSEWRPQNYDRQFRGKVPLYYALSRSLNVPTVNLGLQVGLDNVITTLTELGVAKDKVPRLPSILLGSFTLTPFEVSQMYQSLTSGGRRAEQTALRSVVDRQGKMLYRHIPSGRQVVPEQAAWLTTYMMKQVVSQGTGRYLQSRYGWATLAGKTGTTDDTRDSWFVGADGREVVTVWMGRDDNKPVKLTGASGALRLYSGYLERRQPERLRLSWPQKLSTLKYHRLSDGTLGLDCRGDQSLPVWDPSGQLATQCRESKPEGWLKEMFSW